MVLTWSQYESLSKEELIQELTDVNQASSMSNLEEKFNEFVSKFVKFNSELQQCKKFNLYLQTRII